MDNLIDVKEQSFSFFGQSSTIEGTLKLTGKTHICSHIIGDIQQIDQSPTIIEQLGHVEGKIDCHDLFIHGRFTGEIVATGTVKITTSAIVNGKIKAGNLIIEPGAEVNFEGHTFEA